MGGTGIINEIFTTLTTIVSGFGSLISDIFGSAVKIVYDTDGLTMVGVLMLIGVAVGLFFFAFKWISGLIKMRG